MKLFLIFSSLLILSPILNYGQWTNQYTNYDVFFYSVYFTDVNNGFAVGSNTSYTSGKIYRTTNGGNDWVNISGGGSRLYSVWFPTNSIGLAVGASGTVVKTTNAGNSWTDRTSGTSSSLYSISFINTTTGFVVGGHNINGVVVLKTTDQGETWIDKSFSALGVLREVFFIDANNGWVVGRRQEDIGGGNYIDNEIIYKTTDGGESWTEKPSGIYDCRIETVYFKNATTGWVAGASKYNFPTEPSVVLLKTTNGGDDWTSQINNKDGITMGIRFCDENVGWATGHGDQWGNQYALNYKTTDGGNSWVHQTNLNDIWINYMYFVNPNTGWGTAANKIHKYQAATDVEEENNLPFHYSLSQNYPNPFNPSTKIKYSVPERTFAELKVYDILGREVASLINEEKDAGYYEVNFNATKLSSGVYFYQLKAGTFGETKRMLLLK